MTCSEMHRFFLSRTALTCAPLVVVLACGSESSDLVHASGGAGAVSGGTGGAGVATGGMSGVGIGGIAGSSAKVEALDAGTNHTCAVKTDGKLVCWGRNRSDESTPPVGAFSAVGSGYYFSCGVKADGTVVCWGENTYQKATPPDGTLLSSVACGSNHACGLRLDGTLTCW